jgi:hypothetical protein
MQKQKQEYAKRVYIGSLDVHLQLARAAFVATEFLSFLATMRLTKAMRLDALQVAATSGLKSSSRGDQGRAPLAFGAPGGADYVLDTAHLCYAEWH